MIWWYHLKIHRYSCFIFFFTALGIKKSIDCLFVSWLQYKRKIRASIYIWKTRQSLNRNRSFFFTCLWRFFSFSMQIYVVKCFLFFILYVLLLSIYSSFIHNHYTTSFGRRFFFFFLCPLDGNNPARCTLPRADAYMDGRFKYNFFYIWHACFMIFYQTTY